MLPVMCATGGKGQGDALSKYSFLSTFERTTTASQLAQSGQAHKILEEEMSTNGPALEIQVEDVLQKGIRIA